MFKILKKIKLNEDVSRITLYAPNIARSVSPGQFLILRVDEIGERIPLTVFDYDKSLGTVDIVYQKAGATTLKLDQKKEGEYIADAVGPLGKKSELYGYKKAVIIAGGAGSAIAYPLAKALKNNGCRTSLIAGFRSRAITILEDEMREISDDFEIVTDDGSSGKKGFVTNILLEQLEKGADYDLVVAAGPIPMMKAVCDITKKFNIKTIVSMTAIMIDGTGMCGGCRVTVGGETKFACVDGPDFDGHKVDFNEAYERSRAFEEREKISREKYCRLFKGV